MSESTTQPQPRVAPRQSAASRSRWPVAVTLALLACVMGDRLFLGKSSANASEYHAHVRQAAIDVPYHFSDWLGVDVPVPPGAVALLKPNVLISRRYEQIGSGRSVTLLLVQCSDARDILGHYPPACYPRQGWSMTSSAPRDWSIGGLTIKGMRYEFLQPAQESASAIPIDNFMLLAGGTTARNMDEVERAAQDASRKYFGAAQVQLVYDPRMSESDRAEVLDTFVTMLRPLLASIMQSTIAAVKMQ